ncbi:TetR/AcrR family transcriptional regulator [Promicromonospora vindobonensis]|uniref:TetR/AcrR family transcriptional regulator n=1 Tax=Promicromonospora vindobonensis TaxID=195748 RepID=A0ABW5VKD6_9MICO
MGEDVRSRPVRADARQSIARILDAAQSVLTGDPSASMEQIAATAGVGRATVHRHFPSRQSLLDALVEDLNARYRSAFERARVMTGPPLVGLYRLTEMAFELKISHPFVIGLTPTAQSAGGPASDPEMQEGLERLFVRLHGAGEIDVDDPAWCRRLYVALLHEVHELPSGSPALAAATDTPADGVGARVELLVRTLLGALGGSRRRAP